MSNRKTACRGLFSINQNRFAEPLYNTYFCLFLMSKSIVAEMILRVNPPHYII